ncbi:MAG TPA: hypothetical protein DCG34_11560 [Clostridiales bacterium]|nr:hypothetical protein [Clostridiales bacterium]
MKMFKDTKAVSPVIGIMLMLVVTVILAAAVSSTSTGLMKSSEAAPTAIFEVQIVDNEYSYTDSSTGLDVYENYLKIRQITGDSIPTSDLKIVTVNPSANGSVKIMETVAGTINHVISGPYGSSRVAPWQNDGSWNPVHFGNYTLKPGVTMVADSWSNYNNPSWNATAGNYDTGSDIAGLYSMIADYDSVEKGDWITVRIVHIPTQKVIYQSDVEVR